MAILKIFNLEDQEESLPLSVLSEGEHIIGREKLNCKDKKVSRNHALIIINKVSVTLISTHVNPSFYKPNGGNSVRLIKKDSSITLNDGDQFALLPHEYWFRVRVAEDEQSLDLDNNICTKDPYKETNISSDDTDMDKEKVCKSDSEESLDFLAETEHHSTNEVQGNICDNKNLDSNKNGVTSLREKTMSDSEESFDFGEAVPKPEKDLLEKPEDLTEEQNKNAETKPHRKENVSDSEESLDLGEPFPNPEKELVENPDDSTERQNKNEEAKPHHKENVSDSEESLDFGDLLSKQKPEDSAEASSKEATDKPTGESKTKKDDNPPSSSNTKTKRDRCWFGANCYRKNPLHRLNCSHPGDVDYDTDPEDDRPACPFGDACYRKNLDHRKEYKHSKPPAAKPINTNNNDSEDDTDDGRTNTPARKGKKRHDSDDDDTDDGSSTRKKRKAAAKPKRYAETPEDDYDFEDPFINDASSDDFKATDEESSDSDEQDSQEVDEDTQDTRRLLKEANKFTRKKNKK